MTGVQTCALPISGPTGAFIIIIYGIIEQFGIEGLALATALAGIIQILMGTLKLGSIIKFIPHPIVVGFTSGIAVTIFSTQIKDFFGLTTPTLPGDFFAKWNIYIENFSKYNDLYGSIGALLILLFYLWLNSNILLLGYELNASLHRLKKINKSII